MRKIDLVVFVDQAISRAGLMSILSLNNGQFQLLEIENEQQLFYSLKVKEPDIIIIASDLRDNSVFRIMKKLREKHRFTKVVVYNYS